MSEKTDQFARFWDAFRTTATQLCSLEIAADWIRVHKGQVGGWDAGHWANLGFMPAEVVDLVEADISPARYAEAQDAAIAACGGHDAYAARQVEHLAIKGDLIIHPELARRLGLA